MFTLLSMSVAIFILQSLQWAIGQEINDSAQFSGDEIDTYENCSPWFYFNSTTKQCECFHHPAVKVDVICAGREALLSFGSCMTYNEMDGTTSLGQCDSFLVHNRNVSLTYRKYPTSPKEHI